MKNKGYLTLFLFLFLLGKTMAQSDFRPGFIVTQSGDTLEGEIDYRGDLLMGSLCRFKTGEESSVQEYKPADIQAFRFNDDKFYVSREISMGAVKELFFLECLVSGKLNVFYYRNAEGDFYFVEKEGAELVLLPYSEEVLNIGGTPYLSRSRTHVGILKSLTLEAPALGSRIERFKKPEHSDLVKLAEDYHYEVCEDRDCIVYEKKLPLIKVSVEPLLGYIRFKGKEGMEREVGANLLFWLPRGNEKLYFKTGLHFNNFTLKDETYRMYRVPVQIQYLYPSGAFRPKAVFGANFYKMEASDDRENRFHTLHLGTGFNYKIYKSLFLSANVSAEIAPLSVAILNSKTSAFSLVASGFSAGIFVSL